MSEAGHSLLQEPSKPRRLADAMRDVKNNAADRADVLADIRETSCTRLELLAHELAPVFADVPADDPFFDFALSSGEQPRLWIDAVAHVVLARDRRTYRFVRDTRMGRVVMAETADVKAVVDQVTLYIAERMVERQRMIEGDVELLPRGSAISGRAVASAPGSRGGFWKGFLSLLLGAIIGAGIIFLAMSDWFAQFVDMLNR